MKQTVTYEAFSAHTTSTGDSPSFAEAQTLRARVSNRTRMIRTLTGDEVVSTASAIIHGQGLTLDERDRFTLPDGSVRKVLRADTVRDNHLRSYMQIWFE
jgi:hypothetical protein